VDAQTEPLIRPSLAELKARCWKTHEATDSRLVYRPLSIRLTWLLVRTPLSPNGATSLGLVAGLAGLAAITTAPTWWAPVAGVLLVELAIVFDHVDGEIARAKARTSPGGHFYDTAVLEITLNIGLFAALPWLVWQQTGDDMWAVAASVLVFLKAVNVGITQYRGVLTERDAKKRLMGAQPAADPAEAGAGGPTLGAKVGSLVWGIKNATNVTLVVVVADTALIRYGYAPVVTAWGQLTVTALWVAAAGGLLLASILKDLWAGSRGRYQVYFPTYK
jgi:phosphatidylglycerophosphate synthase